MDMRKVAESLPAELDTVAQWLDWCPFGNAHTLAERLLKLSEEIRAALAQPDMLAEAMELLREFAVSPEYERELFVKTDDLLRRYYAAQKEQNDV